MFNLILDQLYKVDTKIEEEHKALLHLTLLFDLYKHFVTMLLNGKVTMELEEVTATLLFNDVRRKPCIDGAQD